VDLFVYSKVLEEHTAFTFSPEAEGRMFFRNVCIYVQVHTALQPSKTNIDNRCMYLIKDINRMQIGLLGSNQYYDNRTTRRFNTQYQSSPQDTILNQSIHLQSSQLISERSIFILFSHFLRGLPSVRFIKDFLTKILLAFLVSSVLTICPTNRSLLDYTIFTILGEQYPLNAAYTRGVLNLCAINYTVASGHKTQSQSEVSGKYSSGNASVKRCLEKKVRPSARLNIFWRNIIGVMLDSNPQNIFQIEDI
jgi:hypothetical protein